MKALWIAAALLMIPVAAWAGPPFITDDPAPVDPNHTETFVFATGSRFHGGMAGASGVDFNYGIGHGSHINIALPIEYEHPSGGRTTSGLGNIEVAAKIRFLSQDMSGWDVAVYPRLILPATDRDFGDRHGSLFLPLWVGRSGDGWSTFGGGGCTVLHDSESLTGCQAGWVVTRDLTPSVHVGAEIVHETPSTKGDRATTAIGAGVTWDLNEHYHLLAYAGPNLQNAATTVHTNWYASLLVTY